MGRLEVPDRRHLLRWPRDRRLGSSIADGLRRGLHERVAAQREPLSALLTADVLRAKRWFPRDLPRFHQRFADDRQARSIRTTSQR